MKKLNKLFIALEKNISKREVLNTAISKSNVGWHIEHILLTINRIIEGVKSSNPSNYKWSFSMSRIIVFTINKIPRGRARSPKVVTPKVYDEDTIKEHFEATRIKIQELTAVSEDSYFKHPFFGDLKLNKAIKFIELHTNHHLKIINDILESNK